MSQRITKFGLEILGKPYPRVIPSGLVNTVFPLISRNNWRGEFTDETSWETSVSRSKTTLAEEREGRLSRPHRTFSALASGLSRIESARLVSNAFNICKHPSAMPLYSDESEVLGLSGSSIFCDTRWRRFYPGQRVAIVPQGYTLIDNAAQIEVAQIDYVESHAIHLTSPPSYAPVAGDLVFPLVDCEVSLSQELQALTDGVVEWQQVYSEISGASSLPAHTDTDIRYLVPYYRGYPILNLPVNWRDGSKVSLIREGSAEQSGNTVVVSPDGELPCFGFETAYESYSKLESWTSARFFDSRRGRLYPFWAPNPLTMFELLEEPSADTIVASIFTTPTHIEDLIGDVVVETVDEELSFHIVDSVDANEEGDLTLSINPSTPVPNGAVRVTTAHLCRFEQDNLKRTWLSDGVCQYSLGYRSLQNEGDFEVET